MLLKGKVDQASLVALIRDCATLEVEADGLTFLDNTVTAEEIRIRSTKARESSWMRAWTMRA